MEKEDSLVPCKDGSCMVSMEDFDVTTAKKEGTFEQILKVLDQHFEYDSRVQHPADFDAYFGLSRKSGQSLIEFVTLHDEHLKRLSKHGVGLPNSVQGWHLLRRCNLTKEQKQLITLRAPQLEIPKLCTWCLGRTTSTLLKLGSKIDEVLEKVAEAVERWLWTQRTLKRPTPRTMVRNGMMNGDTMKGMVDLRRTMVAMMMNGMRRMSSMPKLRTTSTRNLLKILVCPCRMSTPTMRSMQPTWMLDAASRI